MRGAAVAGLPPELRPAFDQIRFTREAAKSFRETWEGRTCVVYDVVADGGYDENVRHTFSMRSLLAAPLTAQGRYLGYLYVDQADERREWTDADVQLFVSLAGPIATAVENARLHDEARRGAAVEERTRLARELHDSVTQIAVQRLDAGPGGAALWSATPARPRSGWTAPRSCAAGALAEMRALIFELRPDALAEEGLAAALRKHAAARQARDGIAVEIEVAGRAAAAAALRRGGLPHRARGAAQRRQARGRRHTPGCRCFDGPDALRGEVRDDGGGFDLSEREPAWGSD